MAYEYLPAYMRGTFDWLRMGYRLAGTPDVDLLAPETLRADNPWIALAAAVERAKAGDHTAINGLSRFFDRAEPFALSRTSLLVLGDAGTGRDLELLVPLLRQGPDNLRAYAAQAALLAGSLWLVPPMVEAWLGAIDHNSRTSIGNAISDLLEDRGGPIGEVVDPPPYDLPRLQHLVKSSPAERQASREREWPLEEPELPDLALDQYDKLVAEFGTDKRPVWRGKLFSVRALFDEIDAYARNDPGPPPSAGHLIYPRHKFEASTGVDCSSFFQDLSFQPLNAAAVLEEFLDEFAPDSFEDGVRYFFGHPIPSPNV